MVLSKFKIGLFIFALAICGDAVAIENSLNLKAQKNEQRYLKLSTKRFTLLEQKRTISVPNKDVGFIALKLLHKNSIEIGKIFGYQPKDKIVLKLLTPETFKEETGAPSWTSAMFYKGEITIPIDNKIAQDHKELEHALRHEYIHAVIADLSNYKAPAWLDEGLAQHLEGSINSRISPALKNLTLRKEFFHLEQMEIGFLDFDPELVPAAYGYSLFATRKLINKFGIEKINVFLKHLKEGKNSRIAFILSFGQSQNSFEKETHLELAKWSTTNLSL